MTIAALAGSGVASATSELYDITVPANARIATSNGLRSAGLLRKSDRLICRNHGLRSVVAGQRRLRCLPMADVRVAAFSKQAMLQTLRLPMHQPLYLRDWRARALTRSDAGPLPLARLADGEYVRQVSPKAQHWVTLRFSSWAVLYVEGLELATLCSAAQGDDSK